MVTRLSHRGPIIASVLIFLPALIPAVARAQGCDLLLRDGVFNVFNATSTRYSYDKWHQAWCSGTLKQTSSSGKSGATLDIGTDEISIGLGYNEAKQFQEMYQQKFCSNTNRTTVDFSQDAAFQKTADPSLLAAYVQCRQVETHGLQTYFTLSPNQKVFTVSMRYNQAFEAKDRPRVKSISFVPAKGVRCKGTITPPMTLDANSNSLQCERLTDDAVSVLVNTDLGAFTRDLSSVTPPPSDQERVLAALPRGTILAWAAKVAVPGGWHICDGEAGTPNLLDRYPVGTNQASKVAELFGEATHSHAGTGLATENIQRLGWSACCNFQTGGNSTFNHQHPVTITTDAKPNNPPSARVMFIMKL